MICWQAVFFDFDGVILDSVHVKTKAFAQMFRQFGPEIEQKVVAYHLEFGGISRFEKFRYFYNTLLDISISEEQLQKLGEEFSDLVLSQILAAPYISGSLETLNMLKQNNIPAFVVSGTPDDEIKFIVKKRNLRVFFLEVHGSPRQKDAIILDIVERYGYDRLKCLFIGDAMSDYKAAQRTGISFLGIVPEGEQGPFPPSTHISNCVRCEF